MEEEDFHYVIRMICQELLLLGCKVNQTYKILLPKIVPHVCRYTFCSEEVKKGIDPRYFNILWSIQTLQL